ncbi:hypothetical protein TSAR_013743 [Trichomalopsis sarcophagae]|uniref:Uncharacterized protein n=1 Tax=Trichomalopsis sarcophagae TaxID=543379 RepID=A0A232FBS3_9HYME|nr:hypothetical protein TSAR_013743 [Trichomalopsis sarcophagae]
MERDYVTNSGYPSRLSRRAGKLVGSHWVDVNSVHTHTSSASIH